MTDPIRLAAAIVGTGYAVFEPSAAELALSPAELAARIHQRERAVIERNNRAGAQYWERATHLLRKKDFERCR